jgi:hypothetical protein
MLQQFRWVFLTLCSLLAVWGHAVEIIDLLDTLDAAYDLTWTMPTPQDPAAALRIDVERNARGQGYQLTLTGTTVTWTSRQERRLPLTRTLPPATNATAQMTYTLKRRPGTVAVLVNHRCVLVAPAPPIDDGALAMAPAEGITLGEVRYRNVEPCRFGDDFMRPEALERFIASLGSWTEDAIWQVAFFRKADPVTDPTDPETGFSLTNPWQLSLYPVPRTTTNGFWLLYTGTGPSWVVATPTLVPPHADRYSVEAAVKPEYCSEVGLIAAYQDARNFLRFRWRPRDHTAAARAILEAYIDGEPRILATASRGFAPEQWCRMRINLGWQRVQVVIDDLVLLESDNPGPAEGRVGLYADGSDTPWRPVIDQMTATMYSGTDEKTGQVINDAAEAMRSTSCIYFDDVRVSPWVAVDDLFASGYTTAQTGTWQRQEDGTVTATAGRYVTAQEDASSYAFEAQLQLPAQGEAGLLFHLDEEDAGYAWLLTPSGQRLCPIRKGALGTPLSQASTPIAPDTWVTLRVEARGSYVAMYCDGQRVMEHDDPARTGGRCGTLVRKGLAHFRQVAITPLASPYRPFQVHAGFDGDKWLAIWSSAEADWYPDQLPTTLRTPQGDLHTAIGAAAPLPTDQSGLYWHKGAHYHDLRITLPLTTDGLAGQQVLLTTNYQAHQGYRLELHPSPAGGLVKLYRQAAVVGEAAVPMTARTRLVVERLGSYLRVSAHQLDPEECLGEPSLLREDRLVVYRDPHPLPAEQVGFVVTTPALPAARVTIDSDRIREAFEASPVDWVTQSGIWAVMARYTCTPYWNWFGGFGAGTPTVWSKYRLEGDQVVEAYLGVKMLQVGADAEYYRRYRDLNLTICADGQHVNTGYTVIRHGRRDGRPTTMLLRNGQVVQTSTAAEHLLPMGHRQWFPTRIEKRGGEIKVFLDNRLAMTYVDPEPLSGGYTAIWSVDNGIMIGRVNLSAARMTRGEPQAFTPHEAKRECTPLSQCP